MVAKTNRTKQAAEEIALALERIGISPNVSDSNFEPANLVDALHQIATGLHDVAAAIREGHAK